MNMKSYKSICGLWTDDRDLAEDTGATVAAVQKWRQRDKIPPGWWQSVVDAAERRNLKGVSLSVLANIAEKRRAA